MAFTDEQNEQIRNDLIREAQRCGITIGMRKTSVEQLTEAVGISKGSFYKFFDSKELLFFAVLEDIHTECFAAAQKSLQENAPLFPADRAAAAILAACRWLSHPYPAGRGRLAAEGRHGTGSGHGARLDFNRLPSGADWGTLSAGAGNAGAGRLS